MIKMNLKCTRCKAGWVAEGMPEQFYRDALNEFLAAHKECAPEERGAVDNSIQQAQPKMPLDTVDRN